MQFQKRFFWQCFGISIAYCAIAALLSAFGLLPLGTGEQVFTFIVLAFPIAGLLMQVSSLTFAVIVNIGVFIYLFTLLFTRERKHAWWEYLLGVFVLNVIVGFACVLIFIGVVFS